MITKVQRPSDGRRRAADRRAQILEVATTLFSRLGYQRTTLKHLADECGITEPALYRYYESKDELYRAVLHALSERLRVDELFARLDQADDVEEILSGLARFIVGKYSQETELSRLLFFSLLEGHPQAEAAFRSLRYIYVDFLKRRLKELRRQGKIQPVQPEITARCFIGMVMDCALGMHLWPEMQGRRYEAERVIRNNVPIYVRGLRQAGGDHMPDAGTGKRR